MIGVGRSVGGARAEGAPSQKLAQLAEPDEQCLAAAIRPCAGHGRHPDAGTVCCCGPRRHRDGHRRGAPRSTTVPVAPPRSTTSRARSTGIVPNSLWRRHLHRERGPPGRPRCSAWNRVPLEERMVIVDRGGTRSVPSPSLLLSCHGRRWSSSESLEVATPAPHAVVVLDAAVSELGCRAFAPRPQAPLTPVDALILRM